MPGFKTEKRPVTVVQEVRTVDVGGLATSAQIVNDYVMLPARNFKDKYGCRSNADSNFVELRCLAFAAAQNIAKYLSAKLRPEDLTACGLTPDLPCAIEPTWTSSDGKTTPISKMPTPYLQSVRRFAASMTERDNRGKPR